MQTRSQTKLLKTKHTISTNTSADVSVKVYENSSSPVTRSQTKQFTQVFDFDESSSSWLLNKKKLGNGTYCYKSSGMTTRSGKVYV